MGAAKLPPDPDGPTGSEAGRGLTRKQIVVLAIVGLVVAGWIWESIGGRPACLSLPADRRASLEEYLDPPAKRLGRVAVVQHDAQRWVVVAELVGPGLGAGNVIAAWEIAGVSLEEGAGIASLNRGAEQHSVVPRRFDWPDYSSTVRRAEKCLGRA